MTEQNVQDKRPTWIQKLNDAPRMVTVLLAGLFGFIANEHLTVNTLEADVTIMTAQIEILEKDMNTQIEILEKSMNTQLGSLETNMNTRFDALEMR